MAQISIIMPIYNGKDYIHRSVDSLVNQTFKDLEIILVDDGSTDGSGEICNEYASKDSRIKVIHQENGGPAKARNTGVAASTSPFIGFVDCDDYATSIMFEVLYGLIKKTDSDIACCNSDVFDGLGNKRYFNPDFTNYDVWEGQDIYYRHVVQENRYISTAMWDKLYKREIVLSYPFEENKAFEDLRLIPKFLTKCKRVVYTGQPLYRYFENKNSLTRGRYFNKHWLEWLDANNERLKIYEQYSPDNVKYIYAIYVDNALSIMFRGRHHIDLKPVRKQIRTEMFDVLKKFPDLPLSSKCRKKLRLFKFSRPLYYISMFIYDSIIRKIIHK